MPTIVQGLRAISLAAALVVSALSCTAAVGSHETGPRTDHLLGGTLRVGVVVLSTRSMRDPAYLDPRR
jgi:hypothetical protein